MSIFSQTCERLRDYLKDRPDASSAITPLFHRTASNNDDDQLLPMPKQQMTIFYAGRVIVLENVSSHTADQLMRIASNLAYSSPPQPQSPSTNTSSNLFYGEDMSQTRTRSLTRFFEKRKDRIKGRAPYTLSDRQQYVDKSWLSLSSSSAAAKQ